MIGDLFLPCDTPEAPKQGFFKNLFGGGTFNLDREELCESHKTAAQQNWVVRFKKKKREEKKQKLKLQYSLSGYSVFWG